MRKKIGLILGVVLLLIAVLSGCGKTPEDSAAGNESAVESSTTAGNLVVKMLNVGQGDAILIQTSEQTVLIDTSDIDERDKLRRELTKAGVKKIDKVILTHPHADHIGGMEVVLDQATMAVAVAAGQQVMLMPVVVVHHSFQDILDVML